MSISSLKQISNIPSLKQILKKGYLPKSELQKRLTLSLEFGSNDKFAALIATLIKYVCQADKIRSEKYCRGLFLDLSNIIYNHEDLLSIEKEIVDLCHQDEILPGANFTKEELVALPLSLVDYVKNQNVKLFFSLCSREILPNSINLIDTASK